jgi:DNA-binding transcriptional MerR regulator
MIAMTVNELARRARVAPHVVRYYARIGLLRAVRQPGSGYRLFTERECRRLRFIRQAQALGFSLAEIGAILEEGDQGKSPCPRVRDILRRRIKENEETLKDLIRLQERMQKALKTWAKMPDGLPDGETVCHLIEAVGDSDTTC